MSRRLGGADPPRPLRARARSAAEHSRRVPVLGQELLNQHVELARQFGAQGARRRRVQRSDIVHDRQQARSPERRLPRRRLVQHRAEREQVGPEIERLAAGLLGRHVGDRPDGGPGIRQVGGHRRRIEVGHAQLRPMQFGQAEIEHLCPPLRRDHDVRRFDIAVDQPDRVCCGEGVSHLRTQVEQPRQLQRPTPDHCLQRLALDVFHHDKVRAVGLFDRVDDDDVGMVEDRGRRASRSRRCLALSSCAVSGGSRLMATYRPSRESSAL